MQETLFFFYTDHLGSKLTITDRDGNVISDANRMKYDIWGNTDTPAESELPSFTGKQQDASGLYYFNARYYDPETMRFLQEDPAKEGLGWYNYVGNNPVNATDPDGMMQEHGTGGSGSNRTGDDTLLYMPGRIPRRSGETRWQAFTRFAGEIFDNAADDFLLLGQQFAETAELQARQNLLISETLFDVGMSSAAGAASPFYIVFQLLFETPDYIMVEAEESKAQRNYAYRHGGYMPNPWYRQEYLNPEAVRWDDENNRFYTSTASDLEVALSVIEVALFFVDGLVLLKTSLTRSQNYRIAQMIISEDDALQMALDWDTPVLPRNSSRGTAGRSSRAMDTATPPIDFDNPKQLTDFLEDHMAAVANETVEGVEVINDHVRIIGNNVPYEAVAEQVSDVVRTMFAFQQYGLTDTNQYKAMSTYIYGILSQFKP